jgi:hypothetical protein
VRFGTGRRSRGLPVRRRPAHRQSRREGIRLDPAQRGGLARPGGTDGGQAPRRPGHRTAPRLPGPGAPRPAARPAGTGSPSRSPRASPTARSANCLPCPTTRLSPACRQTAAPVDPVPATGSSCGPRGSRPRATALTRGADEAADPFGLCRVWPRIAAKKPENPLTVCDDYTPSLWPPAGRSGMAVHTRRTMAPPVDPPSPPAMVTAPIGCAP